MQKRTLVLRRHGRSRADEERVHEGRYDSPLTEVGRDQATRLAEHWRASGIQFDRIVCSSLVLAADPADIVPQAIGVAIEVSGFWRDAVHGPLTSLAREAASER